MATAYNKATGQTSDVSTAVNTSGAPAATSSAAPNSAEEAKKKTIKDQFKAYDDANKANINKIFDSGIAAQKSALLNAYNQNTAAQGAQRAATQQNYDAASYDIGVQNARNAANLTQFANVRDVNTGLGSQHQLSLGNAAARANAAIDFQRQQALQENERQRQLMTTTYNNQVAAALADNDYKRAAALLDDYQNNQKWQEQQAQILASYGNFDPYKQLYGDTAGTAMQKVWQAQNPEVAYRTGAIDAETYKKITGKYPEGYTPPRSGYMGGYGWYDPRGGSNDNDGLKLAGKIGFAPQQTASLYGLNNASMFGLRNSVSQGKY